MITEMLPNPRPSRPICAFGGMALLSLASLVHADTGIDDTLTRLAADELAIVALGERIYADNCASCHGAELAGQPDWAGRSDEGLLPAPPHDASGHTWHHADDLLFEITKYGPARVIGDPEYRSAMPAYEAILSDEEIVAALSYIVSLWPQPEREWQEEVNRTQLEASGASVPGESLLDQLFK